MGWVLAIDVGTTSTAAARRLGSRVEMIRLQGAARMSSAVFWREGTGDAPGRLVLGDEAEELSALAPWCLERAPKSRIGEQSIQLGEKHFPPADLIGALLAEVLDEALRLSGGEMPDEVRLTHPARWGKTRLNILSQAAEIADLPGVVFVPEPVAAAIHFASEKLEAGQYVAVYDLGGGTFDTAVLKRTSDDFEVIGQTGGNQELGGEDLDELLYRFLGDQIPGDLWEKLRTADTLRDRSWGEANRNLLRQVRRTKERLSRNSRVEFYLPSPVDREVEASAADFERLITPVLRGTISELERTILAAGHRPDDMSAVYLAGGSSSIPLVGRLIEEELGIAPEHLDDPKAVIAMGAARMADSASRRHGIEAPTTPAQSTSGAFGEETERALPPPPPPPPPPTTTDGSQTEADDGDETELELDRGEEPPAKRPPAALLAGLVALVAAVLVAVLLSASGGDDPGSEDESSGGDSAAVSGPGAKPLDLQVGDVVPLSGDLAAYGPAGQKAADLAVDQIDSAIDESGSDHTVTISHEDDQTRTASGVSAARGLISDGADCLTGAWASSISIPIASRVSVPAEVPQISPASSSDALTDVNDDGLLSRVVPPDSLQGGALAAFIAGELGSADGRVVNIGARDDSYGNALSESFTEAWTEEGGRIGETVIYDPALSDYSSEAQRMVGGSPDATVFFDFPETFGKVASALNSAGWKRGRAFGSDGLASPSLGDYVDSGSLTGFRVLTTSSSPNGTAADTFDQLYSSAAPAGVERGTFDAQNFDAVMLCYLAAVAAGSTDGRDMAAELQDLSAPPGTQYTFEDLPEAVGALENGEDINYEGASGPVDLDENGDPTSATFDISLFNGSGLDMVTQTYCCVLADP